MTGLVWRCLSAAIAFSVMSSAHAAGFTLSHAFNGTSVLNDDPVDYTPRGKIALTVSIETTDALPAQPVPHYELTLPAGFTYDSFDCVSCMENCDTCTQACPTVQACGPGQNPATTVCDFTFDNGLAAGTTCFDILIHVPAAAAGQYGLTGSFQVGNSQSSTAQRLIFKPDTGVPTVISEDLTTIVVNCGGPVDTQIDDVTATDDIDGDINSGQIAVSYSPGFSVDTPGDFTMTYSYTDTSGNVGRLDRDITVLNNCTSLSFSLGGAGIIPRNPCTGGGASAPYFYLPGGKVDLNVSVNSNMAVFTPLTFRLTLPDGLTLSGVDGPTPPGVVACASPDPNTFCFEYTSDPGFPASYVAHLNVAADADSDFTIAGELQGVDVSNFQSTSVAMSFDTTPPQINASIRVPVNCSSALPVLATAFDNAEGDITCRMLTNGIPNANPSRFIDTTVPGTYILNYAATDTQGNTSTLEQTVVVLDNCVGPGENPCADNCAGETLDTDGDGITDCRETCFTGTLPNAADSDLDGMDDLFETTYSPPLNASRNDAAEDGDGDGLTNLQEYQRGSDPSDPNDPQFVYIVSRNGGSNSNPGTRTAPLFTIARAIELAAEQATASFRGRVIVLGGVYPETVDLVPFVDVSGEPQKLFGSLAVPVITGAVTAADNSSLSNLSIDGLKRLDVLVDATGGGTGINFTLSGVSMRRGKTAVLTDGLRGGETVIEGCRINEVSIGVDVLGAVPKVRRSSIGNVQAPGGNVATGIYVRATTLVLPQPGSLGDTTDPTVGYNQFNIATILGPPVINERDNVLKMELNDWKSNDEAEIGGALLGQADFVPFLAKNASVLAASLFCTVIDGATQERVTDASLLLSPSAYTAVTENENGVYGFPALSEGSYRLTTTATGFAANTTSVSVRGGQLTGLVITLGTPTNNGGCNGNAQQQAKLREKAGDLMMSFTALAAMVAVARFSRRES